MAESSGKGAKILLIISVIILALTVLFTAAYALVLGPDAKFGPNAQKGGSSAGTETDGEAAPFVDMSELTETPDWQKDEIDLEEAAKQIEAAKPDEPKPIENPFKDVTETDYSMSRPSGAQRTASSSATCSRPRTTVPACRR